MCTSTCMCMCTSMSMCMCNCLCTFTCMCTRTCISVPAKNKIQTHPRMAQNGEYNNSGTQQNWTQPMPLNKPNAPKWLNWGAPILRPLWYVYEYAHVHVYVHLHAYVYMYVFGPFYMYVYACMYTHMCIRVLANKMHKLTLGWRTIVGPTFSDPTKIELSPCLPSSQTHQNH